MKRYITRQEYQKLFGVKPDIKGERFYIMGERAYKTERMNNLFHGLLTCYWNSGCSSYPSYDELRSHFKDIAGLVDVTYPATKLEYFTKTCLFKAIQMLPISPQQREIVYRLLRGEKNTERSWAEATKAGARDAINALLKEMDEANVIASSEGKKYEEILRGINELYDFDIGLVYNDCK